jgi:hypothetical protein
VAGGLPIQLFLAACCGIAAAQAQQISIVSEFQRFDPYGTAVTADRDLIPREILSPAVPRNGHLSVRVLVTGPPHTNYLLYFTSNPPGILDLTMYREEFSECGGSFYPDWLAKVTSPSFGAIPESLFRIPEQTTRSYLLDIRTPVETPPRRVRVEVLLKTGIWQVAPMEVRITAPMVPHQRGELREDIAPLADSSAATAERQLGRYLAGLDPEFPPGILRARDIVQRNSAEDMLLARSLRPRNPELGLLAFTPLMFPESGAEWFLRVRDFLYSWQ